VTSELLSLFIEFCSW